MLATVRASRAMANDITRIRRDAIAEITRQLEAARRLILRRLAVAEDAQTRQRLRTMQADVERHLEDFRRQAIGTATAASARAVQAGIAGVRQPLAAVGIDLTPRINPHQLTAMRVALTDLVTNVSTSTKNRINAQLAQVLIGTQDLSGAVTRVQQLLGSARKRARTIVYTELGRINSAAAQASMEEAARLLPGMKKRWVHSGKKHPRIDHLGAHGQVVDVDQPFIVGGEELMYPRDPDASARNTINCGCRHIPVVDGSSWGKSTAQLDMDTPGAPLTMHRDPNAPVPADAITQPVAGLNVVQAPGGIVGGGGYGDPPSGPPGPPGPPRPPDDPRYTGLEPALVAALAVVEPAIARRPVEHLHAYRADGAPIGTWIGETDRVVLPQQVLATLEGAVVTHNHPSGWGFSRRDVQFALDHLLSEIRVVTLNGVYRLRPPPGVDGWGDLAYLHVSVPRRTAYYQHLDTTEAALRAAHPDWDRRQLAQALGEAMMLYLADAYGVRYEGPLP